MTQSEFIEKAMRDRYAPLWIVTTKIKRKPMTKAELQKKLKEVKEDLEDAKKWNDKYLRVNSEMNHQIEGLKQRNMQLENESDRSIPVWLGLCAIAISAAIGLYVGYANGPDPEPEKAAEYSPIENIELKVETSYSTNWHEYEESSVEGLYRLYGLVKYHKDAIIGYGGEEHKVRIDDGVSHSEWGYTTNLAEAGLQVGSWIRISGGSDTIILSNYVDGDSQ